MLHAREKEAHEETKATVKKRSASIGDVCGKVTGQHQIVAVIDLSISSARSMGKRRGRGGGRRTKDYTRGEYPTKPCGALTVKASSSSRCD